MAIGRTNTGGGASLNFKIVGGTSQPASAKENTIWVNTDKAITDWALSPDESFLKNLGLTVRANHAENSSSTDVTIIDNSNGAVIATKTITGTQYYSVFTNQVVSFTTASGKSGKLTCSVRQTTTPFFTGDVVVGGVTIGTVGIGTGGNSSYAWSGEQFIVNSADNNVEGLVWIKTGQDSPAQFNALKKNNIVVYPISAKQFVSGAWVDKTAKSYQCGEWVGWATYLYSMGDERTALTGGWTAWNTTVGITKNSDNMNVVNTVVGGKVVVRTTNKVDLSKYSTLKVEYTQSAADYNFAVTVVTDVSSAPKEANFYTNALAKAHGYDPSGIVSVDISSVNTAAYITIGGADWTTFNVKVYKVWLE